MIARKKFLQVRDFSESQKTKQYERQQHVCPHCMKRFERMSWMAGDHIIPYSPLPQEGCENGKTVPKNLQMLCHSCNVNKSNKLFNVDNEQERLQRIYEMTKKEVADLPEGSAPQK